MCSIHKYIRIIMQTRTPLKLKISSNIRRPFCEPQLVQLQIKTREYRWRCSELRAFASLKITTFLFYFIFLEITFCKNLKAYHLTVVHGLFNNFFWVKIPFKLLHHKKKEHLFSRSWQQSVLAYGSTCEWSSEPHVCSWTRMHGSLLSYSSFDFIVI